MGVDVVTILEVVFLTTIIAIDGFNKINERATLMNRGATDHFLRGVGGEGLKKFYFSIFKTV